MKKLFQEDGIKDRDEVLQVTGYPWPHNKRWPNKFSLQGTPTISKGNEEI